MSAPPYMKLYVADYLGDTHHLGALEHGAYLLLLMAMWRAGGSLPSADANLSRLARCTPEQWAEIRDSILPFFKRRGGRISHKRLSEELAKYENTSVQRSRAGKTGAAKKASKNNEDVEAIASSDESNCRHNHNQNQNQNQKEEDGGVGEARERASDDWPEGKARDHAKLLVETVASPRLDPSKSPGLVTTMGRLEAWKRDGASWEHDVVPVVTALCAKQRGPVSTWKFFDQAIARSIADNRAALEIPEAGARPRGTGPPSLTDQISAEHAEARRRAFAMIESANGK